MAEIMVRFDDLRRYCEKRHCGSVPLEYIKQMPTIDSEPVRRGRWIRHKITCSSMCSVCKKYTTAETPRCPYCGARMDGGAENADQ